MLGQNPGVFDALSARNHAIWTQFAFFRAFFTRNTPEFTPARLWRGTKGPPHSQKTAGQLIEKLKNLLAVFVSYA